VQPVGARVSSHAPTPFRVQHFLTVNRFIFNGLQHITKSDTFKWPLALTVLLSNSSFPASSLSSGDVRRRYNKTGPLPETKKIAASLRRAAVKTHRNTTLQSRAEGPGYFFRQDKKTRTADSSRWSE
jgi:hypothetical protein